MLKAYFFLFGLNFRDLHFRHFTFPWDTFKLGARIFDLQIRQTKIFRTFLAIASSNFTIFYLILLFQSFTSLAS